LRRSPEYANLISNISNIHVARNQLDKALPLITESMEIRKSLGLQETIGYGLDLIKLAHIYERQKKRDLAGESYKRAADLLTRIGYAESNIREARENAARLGR